MLAIKRLDLGGVSVGSVHVAVSYTKTIQQLGFVFGRKKINFSQVFAGQAVGIREVHDDIWLVSFMEYDLGYFDLETRVLEPLENPFGPKVLPM
jgi:putative transposase